MHKLWIADISNNTAYTQYNSITPYTRCHKNATYMCSHIDHLWSNIQDISLEKITIPGSDHYWFVGKL
jgi:hypothetical protein